MRAGIIITLVLALFVGAALFFAFSGSSSGSLSKVQEMAGQGASKEEVLREIKQRKDGYRLSAEDIIALSKAGVDDELIIAMLRKKEMPGTMDKRYGQTE